MIIKLQLRPAVHYVSFVHPAMCFIIWKVC